jgi:hypothetical protein
MSLSSTETHTKKVSLDGGKNFTAWIDQKMSSKLTITMSTGTKLIL